MTTQGARLQTLAEIEAAIWREIGLAALDHQHGWRTPVLATAGEDGADARTVVLREVDTEAGALAIYTDARAAKVRQLQGHPKCTLVMWSTRLGWQLRLRAHVQVHTDGLAVSSRWAALRSSPAARDYLSPLAPGAPIEASPGEPLESSPGAPLAGAGGSSAAAQREFFAVLIARIEAMDWVELHAQGHRRARFTSTKSQWLAP
jgi:pyridoxamine 5'-phosphate oxidase